MAKIYVVHGSTGEYSDRSEWFVIAYRDRARADKHADDATVWAKQNERAFMQCTPPPEGNPVNPFDPHMAMDYTGTDYYVDEVELAED